MARRDLRAFFGQPASSERIAGSRKRGRNHSCTVSAFAACPLCGKQFPHHKLERHAATCDGPSDIAQSIPTSNTIQLEQDLRDTRKSSATNGNDEGAKENDSHTESNDNKTANDQRNFTVSTKNNCLEKLTKSSNSLLSCISTNRNPRSIIKPTAEPLPGLYIFEDFITPEEESQILTTMDDPQHEDYLPWKLTNFNGAHLGKRWGVHCNLRTRQVTAAEHPLPWFLHDILIPKLQALQLPAMARLSWVPNEANAIDYRRKQGHVLKNHVDDRKMSQEPIANLSLAGDCYMTFINEKKNNANMSTTSEEIISEKRVLLKRRCLQVLTGKARYDFSHGIRHADLLTDRRVSLTMRESPLTCNTTTSSKQPPRDQPTLSGLFPKKKR